MAKLYEGIEDDAFRLASAYFGIMEMVLKDATLDQIIGFLADREETDLPDIAARVINGGVNVPVPISVDAPRIRLVHSAPIKDGE